jgi:spermidine/putrescine transport system substrate-binding protein
MAHDDIRILASAASAQRVRAELTRRGFLGLTAAGAAAAFLAACGGDDSGGGAGGASSFNLFTWAEYNDPDLMNAFGNITIDVFNSNEEAIQKLESAGGASGYDMVCPTGVYIPQMVAAGLLQELDLSRITNFGNLDVAYTNQAWDPGNKYSVCKNWGTVTWIYDKAQVSTEIKTWADFIKVAQTEASGKTSVLDIAPDIAGIYFWANGINWTTEDPADLDAAEAFLVNEFAPHIKAFDSFPGINLAQGNYALSQAFNGDARQGLLRIEEAGGDPEQYAWGIGAPATELWMDNWCIVSGAENVDAAYNFMNYILTPENAIQDMEFHGYNPGLKDIQSKLPADLKYPDLIFFDPAVVATFQSGAVNSAQDRLIEIYNNVKAKAGA